MRQLFPDARHQYDRKGKAERSAESGRNTGQKIILFLYVGQNSTETQQLVVISGR